MQKPKRVAVALILLLGLLPVAARAVDADLARFATAKEEQIRQFAQTVTNKVPAIVWEYFDAVRVDDWETATNLADRITRASGRYQSSPTAATISPALSSIIWPPVSEMIGAYEQYHNWDARWLHRFGREIISSIPSDAIYFGGTDPGRFVISAMTAALPPQNRFYVLTQNQLADQYYLDYERQLYGPKLYVPTPEDSQAVFAEYAKDAIERKKAGHLMPGEDVEVKDGKVVQLRGPVAVMAINGLLARVILDKNPGHEFFVEQSHQVNWMYPHLSPHGLIFQLHPDPLPEISAADTSKDQAYWRKLTGEMLGDWLNDQTRLKEIGDFCDKVYLDKNLTGFTGDRDFIKDKTAQYYFSQLRSAQATLYQFRAMNAQGAEEKIRMQNAADLAFRQAYSLCPYSHETTYRYTQFLLGLKRPDDAFLMLKTSLHLEPDDPTLHQLMEMVRQAQ